MSALTSLLARDHAVPVRKIEEALQKQVVTGGDIGSILLESEAILENPLAAYHAALYGLLPATRDEVMRVARDTIRLVPREVAEKHRLVPLAVDGRALIVAMGAPLDHDVESQLGFLLGYDLVTRIVCEARVSAALLHHYGVEAPARHRRLIDLLRHRDPGPVPYVAPPELGKLDSVHRGLVPKKSSASAWLDEPDEPEPPPPPAAPRTSAPPVSEGRSTDPMGFSRHEIDAAELARDRMTLPELSAGALVPADPPVDVPLDPPVVLEVPLEPEPEPFVDGRATSPYGRSLIRPASPSDAPLDPELERAPVAESAPITARTSRPQGAPGSETAWGSESATSAQDTPSPESPSPQGPSPESAPGTSSAPGAERLSVAPIVGVGVRRSSFPPARAERARTALAPPRAPIVEPVPDTHPPEPIREVDARAERASLASRAESRASRPEAPRKLRGPLTAAQAARLLEAADGRDAIIEVLFAFARQFFDYTALFAVVEDRAEGRDAFGDGAPASRVRTLALPLGGDEPSLLAGARRALLPQLGRLSTLADADLAAVLERPRGAFALVHPVAIRGRAVLLLYGDRGGDVFELTDVPELVAFVMRVVDALEKLILRRKREGGGRGFEKSAGESRDALKAAASALRASHPPGRITGSQDRWSAAASTTTPSARRPSQEMRSLVDAIAATGIAAPPPSAPAAPAAPAPTRPPSDTAATVQLDAAPHGVGLGAIDATPEAEGAFRPTEELARTAPAAESAPVTPERARRLARRSNTVREMLGIPRAAPPPPQVDVDALFSDQLPDVANEVALGSTEPASSPETGSEHADATMPATEGPRTIPAPPPAPDDDEPELVVGESDSDPELSVDETDGTDDEPEDVAPPSSPTASRPPRAGTGYSLRDASVDVVERVGPRPRPSSRPPGRAPSEPPHGADARSERSTRPLKRHDPRREDDGPTSTDVVPASRRSQPRDAPRPTPTHDREVPSVIIDMGDSINALVENLLHADPEGDSPSIDALLKIGEMALPALAQAFPGPLWFDRRRTYRRLPRGRDVSAVARAFVAFRDRSAPYVGALAGAASAERRFYALMVASEIPSGPLVDPVVQRVFDEDAGVRALALEVLPKLRAFPEMADQLVFLRRTARIRGKEPVRRLHALAALGAVRDTGALRPLVDLLEDEDAAVRRGAHEALVAITCEDLGDSMRRWSAWADKHEGQHRIEWLMEGLVHNDEHLRTQAGEELKSLTQQYFGFHPALSRKEREVIQAKYRAWWDSEGRAAFR
jgi:HEAT repeat protein